MWAKPLGIWVSLSAFKSIQILYEGTCDILYNLRSFPWFLIFALFIQQFLIFWIIDAASVDHGATGQVGMKPSIPLDSETQITHVRWKEQEDGNAMEINGFRKHTTKFKHMKLCVLFFVYPRQTISPIGFNTVSLLSEKNFSHYLLRSLAGDARDCKGVLYHWVNSTVENKSFPTPAIHCPLSGDRMDWTWKLLHGEQELYHYATEPCPMYGKLLDSCWTLKLHSYFSHVHTAF